MLNPMRFKQTLIPGRLIRRYKRFLADIQLDNGALVTAHTPNTGAMTGCAAPGSRVWLSDSGNPKRKHPLSWELVEMATGALVGVNTALANSLVAEAVTMGLIESLRGYGAMRREAPYGKENSRIDLLLEEGEGPPCYVEVKSVTLAEDGVGYFPDAVSERGSKHLRELGAVATQGQRGVICFCAQRDPAGSPARRRHRPALRRGAETGPGPGRGGGGMPGPSLHCRNPGGQNPARRLPLRKIANLLVFSAWTPRASLRLLFNLQQVLIPQPA